MLKTQITGAKYLSPQTNQMTNLNIAVPADSKDTEFGTSDILLAKDVMTYLNALDSDISKELTAAVEKNDAEHKQMFSGISSNTSKITKLNETVKQLVDHNLIKIVTELPTTDIDKNCIYLVANKDGEGDNVFIEYIFVEAKGSFEEVGRIQAKVDLSDYYTKEQTDSQIQSVKNSAIDIHNKDTAKSIKLSIDNREAETEYGSTVNASLTDGICSTDINPMGIFSKQGNFISQFSGNGLAFAHDEVSSVVTHNQVVMYKNNNPAINIEIDSYDKNLLTIGNDKKFEISRPVDDTEGVTITGVESITAFANPSATEVWATDGSTVDLTTYTKAIANLTARIEQLETKVKALEDANTPA